MSDQDRLQTLQQAAANANPLGFVAIQVSDLRWLVEMAEFGLLATESEPPTTNSKFPIFDEAPDAAERN